MRYFGWLLGGFALLGVSRVLGRLGDLAPVAASGPSPERALWHGLALILVLASLACFIRTGILIWRSVSGRPTAPKPKVAAVFEDERSDFDPDAALARYMANRKAEPATGEKPALSRPAGSFGRRVP
jgi:hypothetical protein